MPSAVPGAAAAVKVGAVVTVIGGIAAGITADPATSTVSACGGTELSVRRTCAVMVLPWSAATIV